MQDKIIIMEKLNDLYEKMVDIIPYQVYVGLAPYIKELAAVYARQVARHNLERAAGQAAIEVESRLSGKTIHGSINSEDPQWVARVNRESITSLEIELI